MKKPQQQQELPFEVGQLAESKSFIKGYRSAWFRCEILEIVKINNQIKYRVKYYDFEDEALELIKLYDTPPKDISGSKKAKRVLMLRPQYPPIFHENELPDVNTISEVTVVVDGVWSVGDMVDWRKDDVFWMATVTKTLTRNTVEIKLPDQPVGEGISYVAKCKDLRPSLNWSLELGWTISPPAESQNGHSHARLIHPVKQAPRLKSLVDIAEENTHNVKGTPRSSLEFNDSISSHTSASSLPVLKRSMLSKASPKQSRDVSEKEGDKKHVANMALDAGGFANGKPSSSDSVSSTCVRDGLIEVPVALDAGKQDCGNEAMKRMRVDGSIPVNSTSDCIDSAITNLEELLNRVKWLKQMLKPGTQNSSGQTWEVLEYPSVSTPR